MAYRQVPLPRRVPGVLLQPDVRGSPERRGIPAAPPQDPPAPSEHRRAFHGLPTGPAATPRSRGPARPDVLGIARAARYSRSAPARSPCAVRTSPSLSWLTDRSRCHAAFPGSCSRQTFLDRQSGAVFPQRSRKIPLRRQNIAEPFMAYRQVPLPRRVPGVLLQPNVR